MVSKNNLKLRDQWTTKQVPHYGLRKLGIGVASVLLSTTIYGVLTAQADVNHTSIATGASTHPVDTNEYHFDKNLYQNDKPSLSVSSTNDPKIDSASETQASPQPQSPATSPAHPSLAKTNTTTSPVAAIKNEQPATRRSVSPQLIHAPAIKLAQVNQPAAQPAQTQDPGFIKAGSVSPSGGMDSNEIIKEAQDLGLNAVTVSLLTDFGDLHGSDPYIAQKDWDKMVENVNALQAKGYKVIIQLYPVVNQLRDVETAWAPSNKDQFFAKYDQLLERTAKFAEQNHVYGMYMATNLIQTEQYEDDWETAIQKVRALYHGQIFFRTNWWYYADWASDTVTNYNNMLNRKFWKDVDVIAIAAYFELTDKANPTSEDLQKALYDVPYNNRHQNIVAQIQALHDKWHKPIFFGELGIPPYAKAAASPWDNGPARHTPSNDQVVANWFDAFYKVFAKYDWWKGYSIFTIDDNGSWYNPYNHPAATTIKNQSIEETAAYKAAQPKTQDVSATDPGAKTNVTRTINVTNPLTKQVTTVTQTVKFKRTATKDLSTNKVSYGNWQVDGNSQWAAYTPPAVAGYTPNPATVSAVTPNANSGKQTIDVTYTANAQTATIKYVDDDKGGAQVGATQTIKGPTGSKVATGIKAPTNYQIVGTAPAEYTFTSAGNQQLTVHLKHQTQTVTDQRTITRTVNYTDPATKQTKTVTKQSVTLKRTGTKDLVTNGTNWQGWSTGQWAAVSAPVIAGYQVTNPTTAGAMKVTDSTKDQTVTFTYSAATQVLTIKFVDDQKAQQLVKTETQTGATNTKVTLGIVAPANYQFSGAIPTDYTFTGQAGQTLTIHLRHAEQTVSEQHQVKRLVNYQDPTTKQLKPVTTQTVTLKRTGVKDLVTNATNWQPWSTDQFKAVNAPTIKGYQVANADAAPVLPVTSTSPDQTVTFTYRAANQTLTIKYVDDDHQGQVVKTDTVTGTTGAKQQLTLSVPANYQATGTLPTSYTFTEADDLLTIHLRHLVTAVKDTKQVTRTINYRDPLTQTVKPVTTQTVTLQRNGKTDHVTKQTTWDNWTTDHFAAVTPPTIKGYHVMNGTSAPAMTVGSQTANQTVTFEYTADQSEPTNPTDHDDHETIPRSLTLSIRYLDDDQAQAQVGPVKAITGMTGQTVTLPIQAPVNYLLVGNYPTTYRFDGEVDPAPLLVHLKHQIRPVHEQKTVTRTINYLDPQSGANRLLTTQTATLNRKGSQDLVTQQTSWQAWSTAQLAAVSAPTITGYTTVTTVPALTVDGQTADQTITIRYQATTDSSKIDQPGDEGNNNHTAQPPVDNSDTTTTPPDNPDQSEQGNGKPGNHENPDNSNSANSGDPADGQNKPSTDNQSDDSDEQPTPATQTLLIQYRDEADQVIQTLSIQGTIGQALSLPQTFPSGWQLAPTATLPLTVTLQADQPPLVVPIVHRHQVVDKDHLPLGVALADLQKEVTRTIKYQTPHGAQQTTQIANLTRTGDVDLVTMHVTFGPWSTASWPAFSLPTIPGYTVTDAGYPITPVTGTTQDTTLTLPADVYQAAPQSAVIEFVDTNNSNKVIATQALNGVTGQTIPLTYQVPTGWQLEPGQDLPRTLTFAAQGNPTFTVFIQAFSSDLTPSQPSNEENVDKPTQHDDARVPDSNNSATMAGTTSNPSPSTSSRGDNVNTPPSASIIGSSISSGSSALAANFMARSQPLGFVSSYHGGTELPQTGDGTSDNIALLGASLTSCLALLGIANSHSHRKRDNHDKKY